MKKILLASPIRGGASPTYIRALMNVLFSSLNRLGGGPNAPFDLNWAATSGTTVAMARDELAYTAIQRKEDEIIFWDVDMTALNPSAQLAMFARLLGHDEDIVAGQYVGHNFQSQFHGSVIDGAVPRKDGLLEMMQVPLGFSKIKVSALLKMKEALPWHTYALKQTADEKSKPDMFEFFPNTIVGPCSDRGKLERIQEAMKDYKTHAANFSEYLDSIHEILQDARYETNVMLGEDFYFCKLARETGLKLYIDNNMIVPHETNVRLPVPNSELLQALGEQWRWGENVMESEVLHLIEGMKAKFARDHL